MAQKDGFWVNWDFHGGESRWCGLDPFSIADTIAKNHFFNGEKYDGTFVKEAFEDEVQSGKMLRKGSCYYFTVDMDDTFKPVFPEKYDKLVIRQFDKCWQMKPNKIMERFIRKATWVSNRIYKNSFNYFLHFYLEGREVYSLPYNDIDYPPNAVEIMSNQIIRYLED